MNARTTALSALIAMRRQNAWADGALKDYTARDRLDRRDAALAARLLYGVVQNRMLLDFYLAQAVAAPLTKLQPVVLDILRLGAYQILFLDKIPVSAAVNEAVEQTKTYANKRAAGLVNGSLRTLARRKDELEKPHDLATKYSHPQPLVDCLRASMDEETLEAFLAADNDIPKTALQANPLKASAEQVAAALDEAGIACEPHPWLPGCFLVSGTGNLESLPLFQSGAVYVQDAAAKLAAENVLCYVLLRILELLHPFMPFLTEEIWQALPHEGDFLIRAAWPTYQDALHFPQAESDMENVKDAITAVRARRAEMNVPPSKKAQLILVTKRPETYEVGKHFITRMAYASEVTVTAQAPADLKGMVTVATHDANIYLPLAELVDIAAELERIAKEKAKAEDNLKRIEAKLANESFTSRAPENVVNAEREKAEKARSLIAKLEESAAAMKL